MELLQSLAAKKQAGPPPDKPYCPHLALAVEDIEAALQRLAAHGVKPIADPLIIPDLARWAYVADPDGSVLELVQWLSGKSQTPA